LVWELEVSSDDTIAVNDEVLLDAHSGEVVRQYPRNLPLLNRQIWDANGSTSDPGTSVRTEGQAASGIADADNVYDFLGDTYNFYLNQHGRDSVDGGGLVLSATVRYCSPNATDPMGPPSCPPPGLAFWSNDNRRMYYGAGQVADDVTGHELTHGVTQSESDLKYENASGAINESFSDVWGEFVDLTNGRGTDTAAVRWLIGEDMPGGAIRNMQNPPAFNDPDRLNSMLYVPAAASPALANDFGGVHTNSGVNNKLCSLLTDGGTFNGQTVFGMGINRVADLYYEVNTHVLTSGANYTDLFNALTQAAAVNLLWGTRDRNNLYRACRAVEINTPPKNTYVDGASNCIPTGAQACTVLGGPFRTVIEGVNAVNPGDVLYIRAGTYNEPIVIDKIMEMRAYDGTVTIGRK
jgi:Zn-dependent metalloprotease